MTAKVRTGQSSARWAAFRRMVLRRADGIAYLDRIRLIQTPWVAVYLHRFDAPDPGLDLHDHPWPFVTMVIRGGYREVRAEVRDPAGATPSGPYQRPDHHLEHRRPFRPRVMRLTECHTIYDLDRVGTRSIVIVGRRSRDWGFYVDGVYVPHAVYDAGARRELVWQEDR